MKITKFIIHIFIFVFALMLVQKDTIALGIDAVGTHPWVGEDTTVNFDQVTGVAQGMHFEHGYLLLIEGMIDGQKKVIVFRFVGVDPHEYQMFIESCERLALLAKNNPDKHKFGVQLTKNATIDGVDFVMSMPPNQDVRMLRVCYVK